VAYGTPDDAYAIVFDADGLRDALMSPGPVC